MAIDPFKIEGTSGLKRSGGLIYEEFLAKLQGQQAVKLYTEMAANSPVIGAMLYAIRNLIRQTEWRIEPADETIQEAVEWADFAEGCLDDMSTTWDETLTNALSMLEYGWSYMETVYKIRGGDTKNPRRRSQFSDGKIGWRKIAPRAQDTLDEWEFDEDGGLNGMWQQDLWAGQGKVFLPIEKALLFRTEAAKGNPEGKPLLRPAVVPYWYTKRIMAIEATGIERDLTGYPVMEVPLALMQTDASPSDQALYASLKTLIQQVKRDEREGLIMPTELDGEGKPTGFRFKLLGTGGTRQIDTSAIITRYETRMAMSVLAEFIMLGMDGVGSFALADSKTHLFGVALGSIMDGITEVFNRFAIPRLLRLNMAPAEHYPHLVHGDIETPDLAKVGAYVQALAASGILGTDTALERKLLEFARLPELEAGHDLEEEEGADNE